MMLCRNVKFFIVYLVYLPICAHANNVPVINITQNTSPEIAELYQQLQSVQEKISNLNTERISALSDNAAAMKEKEQSLENRALTTAAIAATGIGGMELARGLAEQKADKDAEQDMSAYVETFRCEYGDGKFINYGTTAIELPGGNNSTLMKLRTEYFILANILKDKKIALGMPLGIESEEISDKSDAGLYDDEGTGISDGVYASLYRAKTGNETDREKWDSDKEASSNRVKAGAVAAGVGVIGGVVGNAIINKDAQKEQSDKINREYDKQVAESTAEQDKIEKQLTQAVADNARRVKEYNDQLSQHKNQIAVIKQAPQDCRNMFDEYISTISELSPVANDTDIVPESEFPAVSKQQSLLNECIACDAKDWTFNPDTLECTPPPAPVVEEATAASEEKAPPATLSAEEKTAEIEFVASNIDTPDEQPDEESDAEYCPATGNGLRSITDKTKIGDECSSTNILAGEVIWRKDKKTCTCVAYVCNNGYHSNSGRCDKDVVEQKACPRQEYLNVPNINVGNDALKFCESKAVDVCKTINAIKDFGGVKGKVLCNANDEELKGTQQRIADAKLKYYNCGEAGKIPKGITCKFVQDFKREKITPIEAVGLMKEWALKKYNDDIKCDEKSHRASNDYRQCVSLKNSKQFYEFEFKSLDSGNNGFNSALCLIWGLKGGMNLCKNASQAQCAEISTVVNRTFYIGGSATLEGANCIINSHPKAESAPVAVFNTKVLTKEDMRTVGDVDSLYFYDKKLQVNANSDLYKSISNYLFVEQKLPVKQFTCGAGFVDNTQYYNISRQQYNETQEKIAECQRAAQAYNGGGESGAQALGGAMHACNRQYPLDGKSGDLLTCEYDGKPIDFLFKKLDVKWNRKSTAGYQGLHCLSEGGSFTGKSCTLADRKQCDSFNERFKKDYPNSKGMEWDDDLGTCILKDAKMVGRVQKVAEVSGMVALTLVAAVGGGPIVWALSVVEGAALITEATTEEKISDWAEGFLADAVRCKDDSSICADGVLKKHIARIVRGSGKFSDTQNKKIAQQMERLMGMLDADKVQEIIEKGNVDGYIGENRDPDLEKAIMGYYGTKLTSAEIALLGANYVSTALTFATLVGAGVAAGLRQAVKRNWLHISEARQAKWIKWKILKPEDVAALSPKTATREMTVAQAKKLDELNAKIGKLESKTNRTHQEAEELKKLHQERNTLLNKIGTKDADELAKLSGAAYDKKAVDEARAEYDAAIKRRDAMAKYMSEHNGNLPQGTTKYDIQKINNDVANAENKLKELGEQFTPAEALQPGRKPSVTPADTASVEDAAKSAEAAPATDAKKTGESVNDAGRGAQKAAKSKSEKIAEARESGDLGYHGTDADIATDDMIRASANSSNDLGSVGYGIAKDYDAAEKYAVKRLVERQNVGKEIQFYNENGVLVIEADEALNLGNKTGYVYTTAKETSVKWNTLRNGYVGAFDAAQMPHSVEILDKRAFDLDDLVRQGRVKIIEPKAAGTTSAAKAKNAGKSGAAANAAQNSAQLNKSNVAALRQTASRNFDQYLAEVKVSPTGKGSRLPKSRLNDAQWNAINESLARENVQLVDDGKGYMEFVRADHAAGKSKIFDARNLRVSDGTGKLYVRNSAQEMLGAKVNEFAANNEIDKLYGIIRRGIEYPVDDAKVSRAINAMENPINNAISYTAPNARYSWHVHSYNGPGRHAQYHVSLNVNVDDTLIKKLDEIMVRDQGQNIINFKIPPKGERWKTMADPISIYMHNTNPEIERAIAEAAKPYVRTSSDIGLFGRKIDNGVAIAYETSDARADIVKGILNQVAKKDAGVASMLNGRYSVGMTEALRLWASDYLGYVIAPVVP